VITSERKQSLSIALGIKVGILFNTPSHPTKGEDIDYIADAEIEEQVEAVQDAFKKLDLPYQSFPLKDDIESLVKALRSYKPDVVINLCEEAFGDSHLEMNVPALLELLGIPYTGSSPLALGLCQNKGLTKDILKANGIPIPEYQILKAPEDWKGGIDYPLFVKPLMEDASLGISRKSFVRDYVELKLQTKYINKKYRQPALVERYIDGRELNVAILGNEKPQVLPISEIVFDFQNEPKIVDFSAKWLKESEEYEKTRPVCPAKLEPHIENLVKTTALRAYAALYCRDYARLDIRLKDETPYVLEANPNPDVSPDVGFTRSLRAAGIKYEEFVKAIISFALERKPI